jgi:ATP-dependent Lon protease
MNETYIPLFPLTIVLFPGQALPLHIFEQRYRVMARHCTETQSPFGIVFAHEQDLAEIGCTALIIKTLKEYEDGRSDILTAGQSAFRLIGTQSEKLYMEAEAQFLEEDFAGIDTAISAQLEELFNECHCILYEENAPPFETEGSISLAYHVASELPVDVAFRQVLLEERSEAERQRRLVARLTEWYPQLQKRDQFRAKATGNGHTKI